MKNFYDKYREHILGMLAFIILLFFFGTFGALEQSQISPTQAVIQGLISLLILAIIRVRFNK